MEYRIIILKNSKYLKTLYKCKRENLGYENYHQLVNDNSVIFPKKFVNSNGIISVNYKICLVKDYEKNDPKRYIEDEYGRNKYLGLINNRWSLILSEDYLVEEKFYLYGYNKTQTKVSIREIVKILTKHAYKKSAMKQVILIHNKVLIYDDEFFDLVICKCSKDAERLHYELYRTSKNVKIKSLIFNGNPTKEIITMCYDKIQNHTKWLRSKIRKQSTDK